MTDCTQLSLDPTQLDPRKRVRYTLGMVLGEDDFRQEQAYFREKDRLHQRALHGFGTVCGLQVSDEGVGRIRVTRGLAMTPQGQEIRVCSDQCGDLGAWLNRNSDALSQGAGSPPGSVSVFLTLCPRECDTDIVPIAGGPCRTDDESMAASRIMEHFEVKFSFSAPIQIEEDVIRQFGDLLRSVEVTTSASAFVSPDEMASLVRGLIPAVGSPPTSPMAPGSPLGGSPPGPTILRVHPNDLGEVLRAAYRAWTTEVRPALLREHDRCACSEPSEACILLAELTCHVSRLNNAWQIDGPIGIEEGARPVLLSTRVLQEALLCGSRLDSALARTFASLYLLGPQTLRIWIHHPELVQLPAGAVSIEIDGAGLGSPSLVTPSSISPPVPGQNLFDLQLNVALVNGQRVTIRFDALKVTVGIGGTRLLAVELDELDYGYLDREGQVLSAYLGVYLPALDDLSDVSTAGSPRVDGDVLTYRGGTWSPETPSMDHGELGGLADDDHKQYLLVDVLTRSLLGDLSACNHNVTNLRAAVANGEAVRFEQAVKNGDAAGGDLSGTYPNPRVSGLQGNPVDGAAPVGGAVLTWDNAGSIWRPQVPAAQVTSHGALTDLLRDDHPQYLLVNSNGRSLVANLNAANLTVENLRTAKVNGEAVPFEQAVKVNDPALGDLGGTYPNPTVIRLQGKRVSGAMPDKEDVLTWMGGQWEPRRPKPSTAPLPQILATVSEVSGSPEGREMLRCWFHLNVAENNSLHVQLLEIGCIRVMLETNSLEPGNSSPFLTDLQPIGIQEEPNLRNVFLLSFEKGGFRGIPLIRLVFSIDKILAQEEPDSATFSLLDWSRRFEHQWLGSDGGNTITVFHQRPIATNLINLAVTPGGAPRPVRRARSPRRPR